MKLNKVVYEAPVAEELLRGRTLAKIYAHLIPHLPGREAILDVGCGPANITVDVARHVSPARVVGIDAMDNLIATGQRLVDESGLENVELRVVDVFDMPFESDSFDLAYAMGVFDWLPNWVDALKEIRRVLRPGGDIYLNCSDWGMWVNYPSCPAVDRARAAFKDFPTGLPDYYDPWRGRQLVEALKTAGFTGVELGLTMNSSQSSDEGVDELPRVSFIRKEGLRGGSIPNQLLEILLEAGRIDEATVAAAQEESNAWAEHPHGLALWPGITALATA